LDAGAVALEAIVSAKGFVTVAPLVFVLLWSTGYIGAKFGLPHAEPFTFLAIRLTIAATLLTLLAVMVRQPWLRGAQWSRASVAGLLLHGGYLGGVFLGIRLGVPASLSAIIVNLQPVLTSSLAARWLGETVTARQWAGLALGFLGVLLAVLEKLTGFVGSSVSAWGILACVVALLTSTVGTVYQKRHGHDIPLVTGTVAQYVASSALFAALALVFETRAVSWTLEFVLTLAWFVLPISLGAILLLLWLIRHNSASRVSSLFYLVPPLTAVQAYLFFGERLGLAALAGLALTMLGVALVTAQQQPSRPLEATGARVNS
jgi:drug/metabolite transporter (DMT)-like permease